MARRWPTIFGIVSQPWLMNSICEEGGKTATTSTNGLRQSELHSYNILFHLMTTPARHGRSRLNEKMEDGTRNSPSGEIVMLP